MYPISDTVKTLFDAEQRRVLKISYADSETDVVTGNIVTINDAAATKVADLSVAIEPVQDLHGYGSPWPAGGGKNLFDKSAVTSSSHVSVSQIDDGFTLTVLSSGQTYRSTSVYMDFVGHDGETLYLKGNIVNSATNNGYLSVRFYDDTGEISTGSSRLEIFSSRTTHQKTVPAGTTRIVFVIYGTGSAIGTAGDTTTFTNVILSLSNVSYSPYSNICPITGWTGAKVTRCGKNLLDTSLMGNVNEYIDGMTGVAILAGTTPEYRCSDYFSCRAFAGTDLTLNHMPRGGSPGIAFYDFNKRFISGIINNNGQAGRAITFTVPSTAYYLRFTTIVDYINEIQLAQSNIPYEPYTGTTIHINWQSTAGTVYGGTLDVTTGLLTVDRVIYQAKWGQGWLAGEIGETNKKYFYFPSELFVVSGASAGDYIICDSLAFGYNNLDYPHFFCAGYQAANNRTVLTTFMSADTDDDFPLTWCAKLANATTYQLTPTEINTLLGDNTIWADTGSVTVEYHLAATITDADVDIGGFAIDRYCCNGEKLEVGTAISGQMTLRLKNTDGRFDSVVFEGTELFAEIGIADWSQTTPDIHWIPCGYFTSDVQPRRLNTIALTCLDRMTKFDVIVDANDLTLPTTVAGLVNQANTICGVSLAVSIDGLPNANVAITALPSAVGDITYRNLIQWCAGIMGTNAWIDWDGLLRFTWYDGATEYEMTTANRFNSDLYENDLTITGVAYTNDSGIEIVEGTDDYAIDLTGNALAGPIIATVLPNLLTGIDGFAYRPFTATVVSAPYLWPMDLVTFVDKNGLSHDSALTNVAFNLNGMTALESRGMTYAVNERAKPKGVTKEQAQLISEAMERVETDIDESLTQEDIFNRLVGDPPAQGLILYNGQLYINASYINAGYLNADHIRGGTLTLGGQNNQNGVMQVLDASGNVVGTINNEGVDITDGSVIAYSSDRQERALFTNGQIVMQYLGQGTQGDYIWKNKTILSGSSIRNDDDTLSVAGIDGLSLRNTEGYTDFEYANIELEGDSIAMSATDKSDMAHSDVEIVQDRITMSVPVQTGDDTERITAELSEANGFEVTVNSDMLDPDTGDPIVGEMHLTPFGLALNKPLGIPYGGTGGETAAEARTNLGITPANIGAVSRTAPNVDRGINYLTGQDYDTAPSADTYNYIASVTDDDTFMRGGVYSIRATDGSFRNVLVARKPGSPSNIWAEFGPRIASDGTVSYTVTAPSALRNALSITPANIGALPISGGTMTGDINMGQSTASSSAKRLVWTTADGTVFRLRPYNNLMQLTRQVSGGSESNAISINSSGEYSIGNPTNFRTAIGASSGVWPVSLGGTGGTTKEAVRANLDIPYTAYLTADTWGTLFNELNKIALGGSGIFLLSSASASVLSNGKINAMLVATIFKAGTADSYSFRIMASSDTGANIYAWKITSANASGRTTGTVYRYSGTAI